jgi:hypothetical protein
MDHTSRKTFVDMPISHLALPCDPCVYSRMAFTTWTWLFLSYLYPFFETLGLNMSLIWEDGTFFFVKFSTSTPYVVKPLLSTYQVMLRAMFSSLQQVSCWVFLQICKNRCNKTNTNVKTPSFTIEGLHNTTTKKPIFFLIK